MPILANSAPIDFTALLNVDNMRELDNRAFYDSIGDFYRDRHRGLAVVRGENKLTHLTTKEEGAVRSFSRDAMPYDLSTKLKLPKLQYDASVLEAEELYTGISKIPKLGNAVPEVFAVEFSGDYSLANGYIVAHGRPILFTENTDLAASSIARKITLTSGQNSYVRSNGITVFRVKNPVNGTPIASLEQEPELGSVVYNYGSAFEVRRITPKTITEGFLKGESYTEVELKEVDEVDPYENAFSLYRSPDAQPLAPAELANQEIPSNMRVMVEGEYINENGVTVLPKEIEDIIPEAKPAEVFETKIDVEGLREATGGTRGGTGAGTSEEGATGGATGGTRGGAGAGTSEEGATGGATGWTVRKKIKSRRGKDDCCIQ